MGNTLDQAYDEGGAGAGRTITADTGAVQIQDSGGLQIGEDDSQDGKLYLYGDGASSDDGGLLRLFMGADHDLNYEHYDLKVYEDRLTTELDGDTMLRSIDPTPDQLYRHSVWDPANSFKYFTFQVAGLDKKGHVVIENWNTAPAGFSVLEFRKSNADTIGTPTQTDLHDVLGMIDFRGVSKIGEADPEWAPGAFIAVFQADAGDDTDICADIEIATHNPDAQCPEGSCSVAKHQDHNFFQLFLHHDGYVGCGGISDPEARFHIANVTKLSSGVADAELRLTQASTTAPPLAHFQRSRGSWAHSGEERCSLTQGVVSDGDELGSIEFRGDDGAAFRVGAKIVASVDGTPGSSDMPGRLEFYTTPDGSAAPVERMRISQDGEVNIGEIFHTLGDLTIAQSTDATLLTLASGYAGPMISFYREGGGDLSSPTWLFDDSCIGDINFVGRTPSAWKTCAAVMGRYRSNISAGAGELEFLTSNGTTLLERMSIKQDGTVHISNDLEVDGNLDVNGVDFIGQAILNLIGWG